MKKATNLLIRILFIVFILFLLLGFKNVFGFTVTHNEIDIDLPDLPESENFNKNAFSIFKYNNNTFFCFTYLDFDPDILTLWNANNNMAGLCYKDGSMNYDYTFKIWQTVNGQWQLYGIQQPNGMRISMGLGNRQENYIYSTHDIHFATYNDANNVTLSNDVFFEGINKNTFLFEILTPIETLLTGEYSEIVSKANSDFNVINFTVKEANEFSGTDQELMPIKFQCYLDFNNNEFINEQYYNNYRDFLTIEVPAIDCLLKDNTFYYIELFVMNFETAEFYEMHYEFTTDFSEAGIINIENITNSNPNRGVINSLDKGFNRLEEQNKNIFNKIGDIFNLLNPFHENFFGRKLVELIIDGLKSLFIPENEYFSNYFDELNNWFSDRLGFLYYPLDVLFDLLNRFLSLSSENLIINIPEIKEPTTDTVLIKNQTFDFNTLLENEVLKNLHNIYLIIVDAVICFGLVNLLYKKYEEVIAK